MPQYQGVWTLEQQAQAQSNQQWVTDPNFKNTTLLLQADGTGSGSQNQTFLDSSTNNFFITRNGNTTQGSFSPFSQAPGYWGNYFDGSSYLQTPSSTNYAFGTGDFTIEGWFYPTATTANLRLFEFSDNNDNIGANFTSTGTIGYYNGSTNTVSAGIPFTANQWNHVAVVRSSGTVTVYVNGTSALTQASTPNTTSARSVGIGGISNTWFPGYVSNVRILKGTALYTATFTPPTAPLTAITNTQLLTCQSNRFVDNSANAVTFTIGSAPQVQAFGPFAPALQWTPDVVGGSGYFDGTGDYLNLNGQSAFAFGSSASFTIQFWFYATALSADVVFYDGRPTSTQGLYPTLFLNNSTKVISYVTNSTEVITGTTTITTGQWYYVTLTRNSGSTRLFVNGVQQGSTYSDTINYANPASRPTIMQSGFASNGYLTGYVSGFQVLNGTGYSSVTVPTSPPTAITNTSLLLNMTNAGIYDGKMANNLETVGNAQVATSPVKYGSGSMYFGSGNFLKGVASQNYVFGTGDFTVEMWVYPTAYPSSLNYVLGMRPNGGGNPYPMLLLTNAGVPQWWNGVAAQITGSAISLNTWTHLVVCRANSQTRMFLNGVQTGSNYADTNNYGCSQFIIGASDYNSSGENYYGYIDDFRITKGVARYIANFTPPQQALPRQ